MGKVLRDTKHELRDQALLSYRALKSGELQLAFDFIREAAASPVPAAERGDALETAYRLWIIGEYVNYGGERSVLDTQAEWIESGIAAIERTWEQPQRHWLWTGEQGLFLGNLAVYYGALQAINSARRTAAAQRICKDIRQAAFSSFMKGNHFVSSKNSGEVWGDITAIAAPFKLISLGDLALIGSIRLLEEQGVKGESAALLAWYYRECGQIGKAQALLEKLDVDDTGALARVAAEEIRTALSGGSAADTDKRDEDARIHHDPLGGECPYFSGSNERSPRRVTIGDTASIRAFIEPFERIAEVKLRYTVDGSNEAELPMQPAQSQTGENYWVAELPPFSDTVRVAYRFSAELESRQTVSETFAFDVLEWKDIDTITGIEASSDKLALYYRAFDAFGRQLVLEMSGIDAAETACKLSFAGAASGSTGRNDTITGEYTVGSTSVTVADSRPFVRLLSQDGPGPEAALPYVQALTDREGAVHKIRLRYPFGADERFYGMGERFSGLEFSGYDVDNYVFNQYKDQGTRTYMPVPFTFSTAGYGLFLDSSLYSVFRFGTMQDGVLQIEADVHPASQSLAWRHYAGRPLDIVAKHTARTGKPKLPPKWAFGPWVSSNNWDSEEEVNRQLAQGERHRIPSTVMVLEQWSDESTFYIFNDAEYTEKPGSERFTYDDFTFPSWGRWPDPKGMVRRIHEHGIRVLFWQAPVMKYMDGIAHPQRDEDERYMIEQGYGVKNGDGSPYRIPNYEWFRGSLVPDFTNPDASEWWLRQRQYMLDEIGIDGFKTDGGECIYGSDAKFHDGRDGSEMRNAYPNVYIGAFHSFADRFVEGGAVTFSRAGYTGAQNTPLHWAGDEKSTFEAFRSSIVAGLSAGISGIPFWGWDLGGFSGEIPTAELYIRSAQMAAFCPVMQYHAESRGEFNLDRTPWNIAERTGNDAALSLYKKYADIRMNLLPYIYEQAQVSSLTGRPLMEAMLLAYPDDPNCGSLSGQYMFGDALLVAPVTEEGATGTEVYLPEGTWLPLFGGAEEWEGGRTVYVPAELPEIPVFLRADGALPLNLGERLQLSDPVGNRVDGYTKLCFMLYPVRQIDKRFADDLGNAVDIAMTRENGRIEATIDVSGSYPVTLIVRTSGSVRKVHVNGEALTITSDPAELEGGQHWMEREGAAYITLQTGRSSLVVE